MDNRTARRIKVTIVTVLIIILVIIIIAAGLAAWWFGPGIWPKTPPEKSQGTDLKSIAQNLDIPWGLAFLPDGSLVFTERGGAIKLIKKGGGRPARLGRVAGVATEGEGGLLGLAVHPDYAKNHFIYVYHTYRAKGRLFNRVVRYKLRGREFIKDKTILEEIPGSSNHNGGRLKFGPDGLLYITTGDSEQPDLAQNLKSKAGKILRLKGDGSVPAGNPFPGSPVYSLGHRNPQGLAWDDKGRLWATEHGSSGNDEVNLIEAGKNYGWPIIEGDGRRAGLESPVTHSDGDTWAPSGAAFFAGRLFFAGLRGSALFTLDTDAPGGPRRFFAGRFGRLRDVVVGPDGFLYLATNNRDGRGVPGRFDDRILKIAPMKGLP